MLCGSIFHTLEGTTAKTCQLSAVFVGGSSENGENDAKDIKIMNGNEEFYS